jgi:phosphoribosylformylglycinamidine (FGAM) synthase PurS component
MAMGAAIGDPAGETVGRAISKLAIESKHAVYRPIIREDIRARSVGCQRFSVFGFQFSVLETQGRAIEKWYHPWRQGSVEHGASRFRFVPREFARKKLRFGVKEPKRENR